MPNRSCFVFPLLSLLAGCASLAPTVSKSDQADAHSGYVAGLFSRSGMSFALVIRSTDGQREYVMPMGEDTRWPAKLTDSTTAIRVAPGTYAVSEWFTYATVTKETISRVPNDVGTLARPFTVEAGSVTHLGQFLVESQRMRTADRRVLRYHMRVHPVPAAAPAILDSFARAYPGLASQRINCLPCSGSLAQE